MLVQMSSCLSKWKWSPPRQLIRWPSEYDQGTRTADLTASKDLNYNQSRPLDEDTRRNMSSQSETYLMQEQKNQSNQSSQVNQLNQSNQCNQTNHLDECTKLTNDLNHLTLNASNSSEEITYMHYRSEHQMPDIMRLIQKDLSEPYSIYTYRYFIHNWPHLCFLAMHGVECVGAIVCKLDFHKTLNRGYIAMLAVDEKYRKRKIGSNLVLKSISAMVQENADEIVLETEITNKSALCLYENLGFVRDKRLFRYYLNGVDALRLKLWLK